MKTKYPSHQNSSSPSLSWSSCLLPGPPFYIASVTWVSCLETWLLMSPAASLPPSVQGTVALFMISVSCIGCACCCWPLLWSQLTSWQGSGLDLSHLLFSRIRSIDVRPWELGWYDLGSNRFRCTQVPLGGGSRDWLLKDRERRFAWVFCSTLRAFQISGFQT